MLLKLAGSCLFRASQSGKCQLTNITRQIQFLHVASSSQFKPGLNPIPTSVPAVLSGLVKQNIVDPKSSKVQIKDPASIYKIIQEKPSVASLFYEDPLVKQIIKEPTVQIEKQAARLIVIRRRKMKRHRLKKLRKRMKFTWGKIRQKREMRKEKAFQAELMSRIKTAEKFDPVAYAKEKIDKANEVLTPTRWRGKKYPEFIITQLMDRKEKKLQIYVEREKRKHHVDRNPNNYKF